MNSKYLSEAFEQLDLLNEEDFALNDEGVKDLEKFKEDDVFNTLDVIDADAETEEDLEDSYIGKVILECSVCHSKIYEAKEDINISEGEELANVGEECPYCYSSDGYKIIGQVEPYEAPTEFNVEVEPKEENPEDVEADDIAEVDETADDEDLDEACCGKDCEKDKNLEGDYDLSSREYTEEDKKKLKDAVKEGLENLDIETDHDVIHVEAQEKEETSDEMVAPLSPDTEEEVGLVSEEEPIEEPIEEPEEAPEEEPGEEVDYDVDEFDEEGFDELGESFLKRIYGNVDSFKTSSVSSKGNTLTVEGKIGFKSGKEKNTKFVFEAYQATNKGKVRFTGFNESLTSAPKSFKLNGSLSNGKFIAESMNYHFIAKDVNGAKGRVNGTVKRK